MLYSFEYKDKKGKINYFASTDIFMLNRVFDFIKHYKLEITDFKAVNFKL